MQNNHQELSNGIQESSSKEELSFFIEHVTGDSSIRVEQDFGHGYVRLKTSEAELRQAAQDIKCVEDAVLELLRNSRDAGAKNIFVATTKSENIRTLYIIDDGCGIPADMTDRVFDARVTSKLDTAHMDRWGMHGRGMALYSIKVNAMQARVVQSVPNKGCSIEAIFDTGHVPEKSDQSTQPTFVKTESGISMRGPKNISRVVAEFAIEHAQEVNVYLGTPVEMSAAAFHVACKMFDKAERIFSPELAEICPIAYRLAFSTTPNEFAADQKALGLDISDRSARRIMDGEIEPPTSVALGLLNSAREKTKQSKATNGEGAASPAIENIASKLQHGESRAIDFAKADIDSFSSSIKDAFSSLAYSYYLNPNPDIRIRKTAGELTIKIDLIPQQ